MKKRYILLAIATLEIMALPAAANMFSGFDFGPRPFVIAAEIPVNQLGEKHYFVSSNVPFAIVGGNLGGQITTKLKPDGAIGQIDYGRDAILTEPKTNCAVIKAKEKEVIYISETATSKVDAKVIDQSVLISISYSKIHRPDFEFLPKHKVDKLVRAKSCNLPSQ